MHADPGAISAAFHSPFPSISITLSYVLLTWHSMTVNIMSFSKPQHSVRHVPYLGFDLCSLPWTLPSDAIPHSWPSHTFRCPSSSIVTGQSACGVNTFVWVYFHHTHSPYLEFAPVVACFGLNYSMPLELPRCLTLLEILDVSWKFSGWVCVFVVIWCKILVFHSVPVENIPQYSKINWYCD